MKKLLGALTATSLVALPVGASAQSSTSTSGEGTYYGIAGIAGVVAAFGLVVLLFSELGDDDDEAPRSP
jgi:hypothetical protein